MDRINDFVSMLTEGRLGFLVDEIMTGTHHFVDGKESGEQRFMEFRVTWGNKRFCNFLNPLNPEFFNTHLKGKVTVDGLVKDQDCEGTLELNYLSEGKIRYTFDFKADKGKEYHYVGEKVNIRPWNLHRTHTTCYGVLTEKETGKIVSKSITYFRFNTAPAFLLSVRLG